MKSSAGSIDKPELQKAAADIDKLFNAGTLPIPADKMNRLKTELTLVLAELKPLLDEQLAAQKKNEFLSPEQALKLFEKLEPMLEAENTECVKMLDDIRAVPGGAALVSQIEDYDFEAAAKTLAELKRGIKGNGGG